MHVQRGCARLYRLQHLAWYCIDAGHDVQASAVPLAFYGSRAVQTIQAWGLSAVQTVQEGRVCLCAHACMPSTIQPHVGGVVLEVVWPLVCVAWGTGSVQQR